MTSTAELMLAFQQSRTVWSVAVTAFLETSCVSAGIGNL